jgi:hypothetical protein
MLDEQMAIEERIRLQQNKLNDPLFMNQMSRVGQQWFKKITKSEIRRNKAYLKRLKINK